MKNRILTGIILIALPLIYLALVYSKMPDMVNVNYNLQGKSEGLVPKTEIIVLIGALSGITLIVLLTIGFIHRLTPKLSEPANRHRMQNIALAVTAFLVFVQCWLVYTFQQGLNHASIKFILAALSLLFAIIGNYMPNLKPNYVAGYRIPWTLNNEDNWRKTHELAGKLWFFGGLLIMIMCILLPFEIASVIFGICLLIMLVLPAIYSYKLHKKMGTFVL